MATIDVPLGVEGTHTQLPEAHGPVDTAEPARLPDPAHALLGRAAWIRHSAVAGRDDERDARRRGRHAVPGAAPIGAAEAAARGVAEDGKRAAREILPADGSGREGAARAGAELGRAGARAGASGTRGGDVMREEARWRRYLRFWGSDP